MATAALSDEQRAEILRRFKAGEPIISIYWCIKLDELTVEQVLRDAIPSNL